MLALSRESLKVDIIYHEIIDILRNPLSNGFIDLGMFNSGDISFCSENIFGLSNDAIMLFVCASTLPPAISVCCDMGVSRVVNWPCCHWLDVRHSDPDLEVLIVVSIGITNTESRDAFVVDQLRS